MALRPSFARLATFIGRPPPAHSLKALAHVHGPGCNHDHDDGHGHGHGGGVVHTYDHFPGEPSPGSESTAGPSHDHSHDHGHSHDHSHAHDHGDPQLQLGPFADTPMLLADHVALAGAGGQILNAVKERGWAWAPVPANGWVVRGFIEAAAQPERQGQVVPAYQAAGVMEELASVSEESSDAWADWTNLYSTSSLEFDPAETYPAFPTPQDALTPAGLAYLQNFAETINIARGVGGVRARVLCGSWVVASHLRAGFDGDEGVEVVFLGQRKAAAGAAGAAEGTA